MHGRCIYAKSSLITTFDVMSYTCTRSIKYKVKYTTTSLLEHRVTALLAANTKKIKSRELEAFIPMLLMSVSMFAIEAHIPTVL